MSGESGAVPEMDAKPSFDVDKPPCPSSVTDLSAQSDHCSSSPLVADALKPGHAVSIGAAVSSAETTSSSSTPSDTVCRLHSLSPSDRTSSNQTEISERDEDQPELHNPAVLSGIMHTIRCTRSYLVPGNLPVLAPLHGHQVGGA